MATNRVKALARQIYTFPTNGGAVAGDPGRVGDQPCVALVTQDANNGCTVDFEGAYALSVAAINDSGNSAVAIGDPIFYVDGDTPKLSKKAAGRFFGVAIGPASGANSGTTLANLVTAGATATIAVKIGPSVGVVGGANVAGQMATARLATGAVTGVKEATGSLLVALAAGTAGGVNVTIAGITAADEIVSVLSFTTAASIASVADRTAEYAAGAGVLTKAAGTNETNNQLLVIWRLHH